MSESISTWNLDAVQFPRLIAEIMATQSLDMLSLAESMDLSLDELNSLFDRADQAWEQAKTPPGSVVAGGSVVMEVGVSEADQEGSFMNATLQGVGAVAFSIATEVCIPADIAAKGQQAVAAHLLNGLTAAASAARPYGVSFQVQVGPARG